MTTTLIRYGNIPEVDRFTWNLPEEPVYGQNVIIETRRGLELGRLLGETRPDDEAEVTAVYEVQRLSTADDLNQSTELKEECETLFAQWQQRITHWKLELELIDLEWTLDKQKLILYVLNDRGSDCTKLALYAMADNLGTIEVQPVGTEGMVELPTGSNCGSGGCGSGGGCGSSS